MARTLGILAPATLKSASPLDPDMRWTRDDTAASPLVVITTFVLVAILLTVIVYAVAFDRPEDRIELVAVDNAGALAFDVTRAGGGLTWNELTVRFLDRAGTDQAGVFLHLPNGTVNRGDRITVAPQPPAGTYVLLVLHGGEELARLRVDL